MGIAGVYEELCVVMKNRSLYFSLNLCTMKLIFDFTSITTALIFAPGLFTFTPTLILTYIIALTLASTSVTMAMTLALA